MVIDNSYSLPDHISITSFNWPIRKALQFMLNPIRTLAVCISTVVSLYVSPHIYADETDILVYKGELRFVLPVGEERDSMLIQHRSKIRGVVRIVVDGLSITSTSTNKYVKLPDRIISQSNQIDNEGYWITDILYDGLDLTNDSYRVAGRATLFLIGSVQTRNFNVYLRPKLYDWPSSSSINWGMVD